MKVFISWSGEKSKKVAELVDEWLQCTIQSSQPWLSSRSIDRGALWFSEITAELADTTIGIICLTKENKDKPWILFESGALAKGLNSNRVCTLLIDLDPADLENPLAQFNHTIYTKSSLQQLLNTINSLSEIPLKPSILEKVFEKYWSEFELKFNAILDEEPPKASSGKRNQSDMLSEILNTIRGLDRRMVRIEDKTTDISKKGQTVSERTSNTIDQVVNMLLASKSNDEIAAYFRNQSGYSETQVKILLDQAYQRIGKINSILNPLKPSALEGLKLNLSK